MVAIAADCAQKHQCTVVVTGAEDIVTDGKRTFIIKNGVPLMASIVGTGCMAASVIGTFAAVEKDFASAAAAGLVCFEIAAETAARSASGPGSFKEKLFDAVYALNKGSVDALQKVECR
jgi:hydroxyethylthiazole kinase